MWRHIFLYSVLGCGVVVLGYFEKIIGQGKWLVESVDTCPNADQYPLNVILQKKKHNRTHDVFYGEMDLPVEINEVDFGIRIEACKKVDGGCKLVQVFQDKSLCKFIMKHGKQNFKRGLVMAGLKPECPIPKGYHKLVDFPFDNSELPEDGMMGDFKATVYFIKDLIHFSCFILHLSFKNKEDGDK